MPVRLKLVFWIRRHTALEGQTVIEAIEAGELTRVCNLARDWLDVLNRRATEA
jgi:hypothetical protein